MAPERICDRLTLGIKLMLRVLEVDLHRPSCLTSALFGYKGG